MNDGIPSWFTGQWQFCALKLARAWRVQRARHWRHHYPPRDHWTHFLAGEGNIRVAQSSWSTILDQNGGLVLPAGRAFDVEVLSSQTECLIADFRVLPAFDHADPMTLIGLPVAVSGLDATHGGAVLQCLADHQPLHARAYFGEVALRCGFADQGHFTRRFRRHYRTTPTQWRRQLPAKGSS